MEDVSEEDYNSEDEAINLKKEQERESAAKANLTVQKVAEDILEQILQIVIEAHDPTKVYKYDIVDN